MNGATAMTIGIIVAHATIHAMHHAISAFPLIPSAENVAILLATPVVMPDWIIP